MNRRTILIVEAEQIVYRTMRAILERAGYRVMIAKNSGFACGMFDRYRSELALMVVEFSSPGGDGSEFVNNLPTLSPRIPVLFTTAMGNDEVPEILRREYPVLQKPFTAATLISKVKRVITRT